jgi:hypothetical protein
MSVFEVRLAIVRASASERPKQKMAISLPSSYKRSEILTVFCSRVIFGLV